VSGGGFHVPDWQRRVGGRNKCSWVIQKEGLLGATVEVAVGLCEAEAVRQQIGRLVVIDAVTAERAAPPESDQIGKSDD